MESGRSTNDDEEDDDHARDATEKDVPAGLGVLTRTDFLFDETGLDIEKLPRSDGGADQGGERDEITCIPVDAGDEGHTRGEKPIGM